jgi:hypothetical protein
MKLLKTVCAMLICFVLVAAQTVSISHAQPSETEASQTCVCCSCKEMQCCVSQSSNPVPPQPVPAQAARAESQSQIALLTRAIAELLPILKATAQPVFPSSLLSYHSAEVPIYIRNCSYLI